MEAIIRTNDRNLFQTVLHYLRSLHITVVTKEENIILNDRNKNATGKNKRYRLRTFKLNGQFDRLNFRKEAYE